MQVPVWPRLNVGMRIYALFDVQSTKSGDRKIFAMSADLSHHAMIPMTPESADCSLII